MINFYFDRNQLITENVFENVTCGMSVSLFTELMPDSKVHGANMGPTWVLSAPCGPHEPCYQGCYPAEHGHTASLESGSSQDANFVVTSGTECMRCLQWRQEVGTVATRGFQWCIWIYRGRILRYIEYSLKERKLTLCLYDPKKPPPYLALAGELWGVFSEYFGEKNTAIYRECRVYGLIDWLLASPGGPQEYHQLSNIRRILVGNKIVDHSDVVGASPVGAAPTTSSFST